MSRRRKELYAISEEEEREKPLKVNVRRAYRVELDRLFQLALTIPELHGQGGIQLSSPSDGVASSASSTRRWRRLRPASYSSPSFRSTGGGGSARLFTTNSRPTSLVRWPSSASTRCSIAR